ncbi:MAG: molybdate ABC transporter substrate-binding protein, partial [Kangiellaceae bacterium]
QTYAIGKLNLWLKNCVTAPAISILAEEKIRKIAIANPKLAPYGHASQKLLEKYQLWEKLTPKLIYSENIAQVAQLAKLGVIDAALIAESNAAKLTLNEKHCLVKLDTIDYPAISQQLVIMTNSQNKPAAREFALFLKSKKAQSLIKNMGYLTSNSARIAP